LGAHNGTGYLYFYAGADYVASTPVNFTGGEQVEICVWYCGPPLPVFGGQNTAAAHFKFGVDGLPVGPNVPVPAGTPWTQHCVTMVMPPGPHVFNILSGGAAQYTIWFDDFGVVDVNNPPCDDVVLTGPAQLCAGSTAVLQATSSTAYTYLWSTGETDVSSITVGAPGTYWVQATDSCGITADTLTIATLNPPAPVDLGSDTTLCTGQTLTLDATQPGTSYQWQNGSTAATVTVQQAGTYWVQVSNTCGSVSDTIVVAYQAGPTIALGNDTTLCPGQTLLLDATTPGANYLWSDGSTGPTLLVSAAGSYSVQVGVACGTVSDDIAVAYGIVPMADLGNDTTLCPNTTLTLNAAQPGATYLWQDGSTAATYTVSQAGAYGVTVTTLCGTASDQVTVAYTTLPVVSLGNDTTLCAGNSLLLDATTPGASYLWSDGSTAPTLLVNAAGNYGVAVTVPCGTVADAIAVGILAPPMVDLGNDTTLCAGQPLVLNASSPGATYQWTTGSTAASITVTEPGTYGVWVSNACGSASDALTAAFITAPTLELGGDTSFCAGGTVALDASTPGATAYLWSTGATTPAIQVSTTGTYSVTVTAPCATLSDAVAVDVLPAPDLRLPQDTLFCEGSKLVLDVTTPGASYLWSNGSTAPAITVEGTGFVSVSVTNPCGADDARVRYQDIDCSCPVHVPTAFTPNGDGINDRFGPVFGCTPEEGVLMVFDRWGEAIHEGEARIGWDGTINGTAVQDGVYVYVVDYRADGGHRRRLTGHFTLLR
jgi:gliding motility-associated-like protein